jgi:hypothetical protein
MAFAGGAPFDVQNGATATAGSSLATGSVTPSAAGALILSGWAGMNGTSAPAVDSALTITATQNPLAGQCLAGAVAYKIQTTAAAINPTWSWTGTDHVAASVAVFKVAAAEVRVTQLVAETLSLGVPAARVTQDAVETLSSGVPAARVSQLAIETLCANVVPPSAEVRVSQLAIETLCAYTAPPAAGARVTQDVVELLALLAPADVRLTQLLVEVSRTTPASTRVTQLAVEVLVPAPVPTRLTQLVLEVRLAAGASTRLTQLAVEVFGGQPASTRLTQAALEVLTPPFGPQPGGSCLAPQPAPLDTAGDSCTPPFFDPDTENFT